MNIGRRNRIDAVLSAIDDIRTEVEALQTEEQDAYDAMPAGLQQSERGQKSNQAIEELQSAYNSLGDAEGALIEART